MCQFSWNFEKKIKYVRNVCCNKRIVNPNNKTELCCMMHYTIENKFTEFNMQNVNSLLSALSLIQSVVW